MPTLIDIGVNLTNKRFKSDLPELLSRAQAQDIERIIVTGTCHKSSVEALALVAQYPDLLSCTAGVHPHDASDWDDALNITMLDLAQKPEVVAVGECGLDFNRDFSPRDKQEACFDAQLQIAATTGKPVFLHERDAHERFLQILKQYRDQLSAVVVHCFTESKDQLHRYLDMDCYIGVTGWVCDERRGDALREAVPHIPADRLMIETDAPYLLPRSMKPKPKNNRNEPAFLSHVLKEVAALRGESEDTVAQQTTSNARKFFNV